MDLKQRIFKPFTSILIVFCIILSVLTLNIFIFAADINGISVSSDTAAAGDEITVTIYAPPAQNADTAFIKVEFDSSVFEVVKWEPTVANAIYNSGEGFFVVTSANASRAIQLGSGYRDTAVIAVKRNAPDGDHKFTLTQHSLSYIDDSGFKSVELWNPAVTEVTVHIGRSSGSQGNPVSSSDPSRTTPSEEAEPAKTTTSPAPFVTSSFVRTDTPADSAAAPAAASSGTSRTTRGTTSPVTGNPEDSDADTTTMLPDAPDAGDEMTRRIAENHTGPHASTK